MLAKKEEEKRRRTRRDKKKQRMKKQRSRREREGQKNGEEYHYTNISERGDKKGGSTCKLNPFPGVGSQSCGKLPTESHTLFSLAIALKACMEGPSNVSGMSTLKLDDLLSAGASYSPPPIYRQHSGKHIRCAPASAASLVRRAHTARLCDLLDVEVI